MNKKILITVVGISMLLFGCSSSNSQTQATATPTPSQQNSEANPLLSTFDGNTMILTDPVLYEYLQGKNKVQAAATATVDAAAQKKIGATVKLSKSSKYGIDGQVTIISTGTIRFTNFSYNGGCGALTAKLTIKPSEKVIAILSPSFSTPISSQSVDFSIPSSVSLLQFDSITLFCQNKEDSVSSAEF